MKEDVATPTVAELHRLVQELQDEVRLLRRSAAPPPSADGLHPEAATSHQVSRAGMLKMAAIGAAATVGAGALLVGNPSSAAAASYNPEGPTDFTNNSLNPESPVVLVSNTQTGDGLWAGSFDSGNNPSSGIGVKGISGSNDGVFGTSITGLGVHGDSSTNYGVHGHSAFSDGVRGVTASANNSGVSGINTAAAFSGYGVYGQSNGPAGYFTSAGTSGALGVATAASGNGLVGYQLGNASTNAYGGVFGGSYTDNTRATRGAGFGVYGESGTGYGISGWSDSSYGVYGATNGNTSAGVFGTASLGNGVAGYSGANDAVHGHSSSNAHAGVAAVNDAGGYGLWAGSATGLDIAAGGTGRFFIMPQSTAGAPTTGTHVQGEEIIDDFGDPYVCVTSGNPGVWKKLSGVIPIVNVRVLNTRPSHQIGPYTGPIANNQTLTVQLAGQTFTRSDNTQVTIPSNAVGVFGNLTAADATGSCYLAIVPFGGDHNGVSTVNFPIEAAGTGVANAFMVGLASGAVDIYVGNCSNYTVNVIMDITGYIV